MAEESARARDERKAVEWKRQRERRTRLDPLFANASKVTLHHEKTPLVRPRDSIVVTGVLKICATMTTVRQLSPRATSAGTTRTRPFPPFHGLKEGFSRRSRGSVSRLELIL